MKTRVGAALKRERKRGEVASRKQRVAKWRKEQAKRIPAYSTAVQIKKFWEVTKPLSEAEDWESETDSSVEVLRCQVKEVLNLKK